MKIIKTGKKFTSFKYKISHICAVKFQKEKENDIT